MFFTPCWTSSLRVFSRYNASSASGSTSRRTRYVITTDPLPQDSTCRECLGIPRRCARKSFLAINSVTQMPSASRPYLTANSAMLLGTSESSSLYIEGLSTTQRLHATNSLVPKPTSGCHFLAEKSIYLFIIYN